MNNSEPDVFYYNLSIQHSNEKNIGLINDNTVLNASIDVNSSTPICRNPVDYYCSIVRFQIPLFNGPVCYPIVQTPVADINKTVYSFTLSYGGYDSSQTFVTFVPELLLPNYMIPKTGTLYQDFNSFYYDIYDYTGIMAMWNTALETATAQLNTLASSSLTAPFFFYDATTQNISLYTKKGDFDSSGTPAELWFNYTLDPFMAGFSYQENYRSAVSNGKDNQMNIRDFHGTNTEDISGVIYTRTTSDYNDYGYWSFLKSIVVTTAMNINSELYYINNQDSVQNLGYSNIVTDFLPDISSQGAAGNSSRIYIYNAPSLYRVFEFKDRSPLYKVDLQVNVLDGGNNLHRLNLNKGMSASFKLMFIKKEIYQKMMSNFSNLTLH